jgi:hypothetical protein
MATVSAKSSQPITPIGNSTSSLLNESLAELSGEAESWAGEDTSSAEDSVPFGEDDDSTELDDLTGDDESADSDEETDDESEDSEGEEGEEGDEEAEVPEGHLTIDITDEQGARQITFDPTDTKAVTRAVQQAAGARKLYGKYQNLRSENAELKQKVEAGTEASTNWDKFEAIYERDGIDGVVQLLEGKTLDGMLTEREQFRQTYNKWTPEQKHAYDKKQWEDRQAKKEAALRAEIKAMQDKAAGDRDAAELSALEGWTHAAFGQASFAGKLGDKTRELRLDRTLWNDVKSELEYLESKGVALTKQVVDKVVRESRETIGSSIQLAAGKQTKKTLDSKKAKAKQAAQSKMIKGERQARKEANKDVDDMSISGMSQLMVAALNGGRRKK